MAASPKICPICSASNPTHATICWNCGTSLGGSQSKTDRTPTSAQSDAGYDFHYGETDLYEGDLYTLGQRYVRGCFLALIVLMGLGLALLLTPLLLEQIDDLMSESEPGTPPPTLEQQVVRPTVTPAPPTLTPTRTAVPIPTSTVVPTREPCIQTVQAGDVLYNVVARCGHRSFDVFQIVVELNNLADAGTIIEGQQLIIPWPTDTPSPSNLDTSAPATPSPDEPTPQAGAESEVNVLELDDNELEAFLTIPTPTLPPGIQFHTVLEDETMISIIAMYDASVQVLAQLNPEISFNQCNMGMTFGGERCNVMVFQGQQLRVPAPTPTPTLSPTPNGSETPPPSPTATFNAPVLQSPPDRAVFLRDQLITLRWSPTGTLGSTEIYRVIVEDITAGVLYTADTLETSFVVPQAWQGNGPDPERHEYTWRVQVVDLALDDAPASFTTSPAIFAWETADQD